MRTDDVVFTNCENHPGLFLTTRGQEWIYRHKDPAGARSEALPLVIHLIRVSRLAMLDDLSAKLSLDFF